MGDLLQVFRDSLPEIIGGLVVAAVIAILGLLYRKPWVSLIKPLRAIRYLYRGLIGLDNVYPTLNDAYPDIRRDLIASTKSKIMVQMGRSIFGYKNIPLYEIIKASKGQNREFRILHLSPESPLLSPERAILRSSDYSGWMHEIDVVRNNLKALAKDGIDVYYREHLEGFFWKLFIFDEAFYLHPYYKEKDNDASPVFRFRKTETSLYTVYNRYFENAWLEGLPKKASLRELIPATERTGSAILARVNLGQITRVRKDMIQEDSGQGRIVNVFRIFDRSYNEKLNIYRFGGIGGKLNKNVDGDWTECAKREYFEECTRQFKDEERDLRLLDSEHTFYMDRNGKIHTVEIADSKVRPILVYEKYQHSPVSESANVVDEVYFLVCYLASIPNQIFPNENRSVAILLLDDNLLVRSYRENLTLRDLRQLGATVREPKSGTFHVDPKAILKPLGAAEFFAKAIIEGHLKPESLNHLAKRTATTSWVVP